MKTEIGKRKQENINLKTNKTMKTKMKTIITIKIK